MKEQNIRTPWNAKIRRTIKEIIDQAGNLSGVPLQVLHVPSDESLMNGQACEQDLSAYSVVTTEIRIGSSLILLVKGYHPLSGDGAVPEAVLDLVHQVFKEYLLNQAEIESFSLEVLENYQTINMLYRISEALGDIQNVQRVASIILSQAMAVTHAERGSVLLLDPKKEELHVAASYGFTGDELPHLTLKVSDTLCSEILKTGKPLIVEDIDTRPDLAAYSKGVYKTGSFISIPLRTADDQKEKRLLGVLNLSDKANSQTFRSNDLKLLNALSAQASVAIANAQTLKELEHSRGALKTTLEELTTTYENLEKRAVIIEQINKISLAVNATLDLDHLFTKISNYAANLTNAEEATIYYREASDRKAGTPGSPSQDSAAEGCREENSLLDCAEILEKGNILALDNVAPGTCLALKNGQPVEIRNLMGVPFFNKGDAIGAMVVVNKVGAEQFSHEDSELLKTLGYQAAIAVENAKLVSDQKSMLVETIMALAAAVDAKDPYTHNHSKSVSSYSKAIAEQMNVSERQMEILELAAILHDIGKIAVPETILNKPGKLTQEEFEIMKTHPVSGVKILENIQEMAHIIPGMKYHHERYDGKGYPEGLYGEEIPLLARIMAVADTYDAITSDRPYRKGPGHDFAVKEIQRCSGSQFAPEIVEAFLESSICRKAGAEIVTKA